MILAINRVQWPFYREAHSRIYRDFENLPTFSLTYRYNLYHSTTLKKFCSTVQIFPCNRTKPIFTESNNVQPNRATQTSFKQTFSRNGSTIVVSSFRATKGVNKRERNWLKRSQNSFSKKPRKLQVETPAARASRGDNPMSPDFRSRLGNSRGRNRIEALAGCSGGVSSSGGPPPAPRLQPRTRSAPDAAVRAPL